MHPGAHRAAHGRPAAPAAGALRRAFAPRRGVDDRARDAGRGLRDRADRQDALHPGARAPRIRRDAHQRAPRRLRARPAPRRCAGSRRLPPVAGRPGGGDVGRARCRACAGAGSPTAGGRRAGAVPVPPGVPPDHVGGRRGHGLPRRASRRSTPVPRRVLPASPHPAEPARSVRDEVRRRGHPAADGRRGRQRVAARGVPGGDRQRRGRVQPVARRRAR